MMATIPSYFKDFLSNIRLSDNQVDDLKNGHTTLRKRLKDDENLPMTFSKQKNYLFHDGKSMLKKIQAVSILSYLKW